MSPYLEGMKSPLYAANEKRVEDPPTLDRTRENLVIRCGWEAFLPHLRLALFHKYVHNPSYRFRIETDERLFNVWIGNEKYQAKSKTTRDHLTSYNSLKDLIEERDLVIIRLGHMGWKNVAAAGVLKQALMIREVALKPTWIIKPPGEQPYSWDEEIVAYTTEHYATIDLTRWKAGEVPSTAKGPTEGQRPVRTRSAPPPPPEEVEDVVITGDDFADSPAGYNIPGKGRSRTPRRGGNGDGSPV